MSELTEGMDLLSTGLELIAKVADSKVIEAVPVLNEVLKIVSGTSSISDRLIAKKIAKFVFTLEHVPGNADKLIDKAATSKEELKDLGERVIQAVALSTDFDKPEIYAKLFIAYTEGALNARQLGRHLSVLSGAHSPDVISFSNMTNPFAGEPGNISQKPNHIWRLGHEEGEPLTTFGYARSTSMSGFRADHLVTEFGVQFHTAMEVANQRLGKCRPEM